MNSESLTGLKLERLELKHNSKEWLINRQNGIGGSEAAAILGRSPYKSNLELWREKTGLSKAKDISEKKQVQYGRNAEDLLVKLFELDYPEFTVKIDKNTVYKRGFMLASLDAELVDKDGKQGFLEIKTSELHSSQELEKWDRKIPEQYYIQILHYFLVTDFQFAIVKAQLKKDGLNEEKELITRHYRIDRQDVPKDLKYIFVHEKAFWNSVSTKSQPPLILPNI